MSKKDKDGNFFKRHKVLTGVLVLILLFIIIGAAGSGAKKSTSTTTTNSTQSPQQNDKTEFKIGETATSDDKSIEVASIQRNYDTGNQYAQPESGKEFVVVTVNITNNSDSSLDYNTFDFKMQDSHGVQQSESITALTEGKLNSGSLAKGGTVTGKLAYEVPQDDPGLKLLYQSYTLFSNKTITFDLQ